MLLVSYHNTLELFSFENNAPQSVVKEPIRDGFGSFSSLAYQFESPRLLMERASGIYAQDDIHMLASGVRVFDILH
jgi:hypothetical protein